MVGMIQLQESMIQMNKADNEFSHVKKPEFNVFNDDSAATDDDDDNLSTPPFFKNRRQ